MTGIKSLLLVCVIIFTSPLHHCLTPNQLHTPRVLRSLNRNVLEASESSESSAYSDTQGGVKFIIQGLTSLSNLFLSNKAVPVRTYQKPSLSPAEVLNGVIGDFENGYLFSGQIDSEIYDEDCVFTDPTLSFKGLSTFERNIKALKPALDIFVGDSLVVLYDCKIDKEVKEIKAVWRMSGAVNLPWRPRIELTGNTVLSYDTDRGGRIVDYYERWDLPAATALLQLLQHSKSLLSEKVLLQGTKHVPPSVEEASDSSRAATETINVKKLKATILSSVLSKSGERTVRTGVIADAVASLIRASSKEALAPGSTGGSGSSQMTAEQAATYALLDIQNSLSFYEILYSNVNTLDELDPLEKFISDFQDSLPATQFTDLGSSEGVFKSRSTLGPFSVEVVSSCVQPYAEEASILISMKKLKLITLFGFPLRASSISVKSGNKKENYESWNLSYFDGNWKIFTSDSGNFFILQKK